MDPILETIDEALKRKGLSDAAASKLAVGNYALIKNMRSSRSDEKRYNFHALKRLAEVLDLECYFGPPRDISGADRPPEADPASFARLPLYDADLAAGVGRLNDHEEIIGSLAFRRDWLRRIGVSPGNAVLARVHGDSMLPSIHEGDLVLIDRSRRDIPVRRRDSRDRRRPPIYALRDDGKARVKRIERPEEDLIMLISDNPAFAPDLVKGPDIAMMDIIGKVMWWGHTNKE